MLNRWYLCTAIAALLCLLTLSCVSSTDQATNSSKPQATNSAQAQATTSPKATVTASPATKTVDFGRYATAGSFKLNTLPTTPYGPPWADISLQKSNFLECEGASIALCYYSGPGPTTPCNVESGGDLANCTCYAIPKGQKYKVLINAILNLDVYLKTVEACGKDGSKCQPTGSIEAPVCEAINNNTLIPGADMISTFSLYLEKQMPIHPTTCSTPAAYAGCMTAPCKQTGKTDPNTGLRLVQCGCPTYTGPYQVGTQISQDQCVLGGTSIWSAAYQPPKQQ
ncbi:MAG TPA: hypothetical protein VGK82_07405 [Pyrinomonadaceae bacterium]